ASRVAVRRLAAMPGLPMRAALLAAGVAASTQQQAAAPSPNPPFAFAATFLYSTMGSGGQQPPSVQYQGWQGARGQEPVPFQTQRIDVEVSEQVVGQSLPMTLQVTNIDITFRTNGSSRAASFWSAGFVTDAGVAPLAARRIVSSG